MRLGRPVLRPASALVVVLAPALAGCGLFDRGSHAEAALEYLPADTYQVRFADRGEIAERLGVDGIDPRDVDDDELDEYMEKLEDERDDAVVGTQLSEHVRTMKDAPLNDLDIEWEAYASWGDDPAERDGEAFVWKVGDDVDFDDLAGDLEDKGYDEDRSAGLPVYSADPGAIDDADTFGGVYPTVMASVLLDDAEQVVAVSYAEEPLDEIADVITDDADSLADDGGMDALLDAVEDDPEIAWLTNAGPSLCASSKPPLPEKLRSEYDDLGRPSARALFVWGDDAPAVLALMFDSEDAAEEDLEARESLVEDGVDALSLRPFDELGDFDLRQDGSVVLIEEDFDGGRRQALDAEATGRGPGFCLSETD